jgi:hypothetical protein
MLPGLFHDAGLRSEQPRNIVFPATLLLLLLQFLPYLLLWDQAYIRIHDTLEGIDYQLLFKSGKTFDYSSDARLSQIMNGQLRMAVKTGWSFIALWNALFGLYGGYIFNYILIHLIAFSGMYLLLSQYLLPKFKAIALGVSLCFAWVPVFSMLGLSVAGQPLLAWACINLTYSDIRLKPDNKRIVFSWLMVTLFPFYSDIVWAGIPVLLCLGGWLLYRLIKKRHISRAVLLAGCWLAFLFVIANWQLFQITFLTPGFISHRAEYNYFYNKSLSLGQSIRDTLLVFFSSHHHVGIIISLPALLAALLLKKEQHKDAVLPFLAAAIFAICLFYGFYNWLVWLAGDMLVLLKSFKFERIIILLPTLWLIFFALALSKLAAAPGRRKFIPMLLACQLATGFFANDEFLNNIKQLTGLQRKPNFVAFYDTALFSQVTSFIGMPQENYRIVCLGMHPAAAQFNGFYTLDCHASIYSLAYKKQFRKVIADELAKNDVIRKEFDQFGNRCYLFAAELGKEYHAYLCGKEAGRKINQLQLDTEALRNLGATFLFSAVEIQNSESNGLKLLKIFDGRFWRLHLYSIEGLKIAKSSAAKS